MNIITDLKSVSEVTPNTLVNADTIEAMTCIPDKSVGCIICDLPYGTTAASWDKIIPFDKLWEQYERIIMDDRAIVLFSSGQFTHQLIFSNEKIYRYKWVWLKTKRGNFVNCFRRPLTSYEEICVFSKGVTANHCDNQMLYNPQGLVPIHKVHNGKQGFGNMAGSRPSHKEWVVSEYTNFPVDTLSFASESGVKHPNAKPVPLLEYLIRTYSNEGDTVLDNTMGSGTTGVACMRCNRNFIGVELDETYFQLAKTRIEAESNTLTLF